MTDISFEELKEWKKYLTSDRFVMDDLASNKKERWRSPFEHDYDRLIFSSSFRRLQDKTQVFPLPGSVFVHNRLTHSLEVSSVGRSFGNMLSCKLKTTYEKKEEDLKNKVKKLTEMKTKIAKMLEKNWENQMRSIITNFDDIGTIVASACLAHDIGNPPFGHSGEEAIRNYFTHGNFNKIKITQFDDKKTLDDVLNVKFKKGTNPQELEIKFSEEKLDCIFDTEVLKTKYVEKDFDFYDTKGLKCFDVKNLKFKTEQLKITVKMLLQPKEVIDIDVCVKDIKLKNITEVEIPNFYFLDASTIEIDIPDGDPQNVKFEDLYKEKTGIDFGKCCKLSELYGSEDNKVDVCKCKISGSDILLSTFLEYPVISINKISNLTKGVIVYVKNTNKNNSLFGEKVKLGDMFKFNFNTDIFTKVKLKEILKKKDYNDFKLFEGNANALRVLAHNFEGANTSIFNLTYTTMASIIKYPFASSSDEKCKKFGYFQSEKEKFVKIVEKAGLKIKYDTEKFPRCYRHPFVYLVEAADDICYQIMDIEDAHRLKILSYVDVEQLFLNFFTNKIDIGSEDLIIESENLELLVTKKQVKVIVKESHNGNKLMKPPGETIGDGNQLIVIKNSKKGEIKLNKGVYEIKGNKVSHSGNKLTVDDKEFFISSRNQIVFGDSGELIICDEKELIAIRERELIVTEKITLNYGKHKKISFKDKNKIEISDENEKIAYLRGKAINKLAKCCFNVFWENRKKIMGGNFNEGSGVYEENSLFKHMKKSEKLKSEDTKTIKAIELEDTKIIKAIELEDTKTIKAMGLKCSEAMRKCENKIRQVYDNNSVVKIELAGYEILETVQKKFDIFWNFVSGMTDEYAWDLYHTIKGMGLSKYPSPTSSQNSSGK
ncbi:dGTPase [Entamoeba marina]